MHWLHGRDVPAIRAELRRTELALDALNVYCGDFAAGDRGFAADPARRSEFRASIKQAILDAATLDAPKMHILVGKRNPAVPRAAQFATVAVNLAWAAERLNAAGKVGLLELLNPYDNPGYLIESTADVAGLLDAVGSPALRIQFDFYHLQRVEGELLRTFARLRDRSATSRSPTRRVAISPGPARSTTAPCSGRSTTPRTWAMSVSSTGRPARRPSR